MNRNEDEALILLIFYFDISTNKAENFFTNIFWKDLVKVLIQV